MKMLTLFAAVIGCLNLTADSFRVSAPKVKDIFRVETLFVTPDDIFGEVTGSYTEKTFFSHNDEIYVFLNAKDIPSGTRFTVVSFPDDIDKKIIESGREDKAKVGRIATVAGVIEIKTHCKQLSRAVIVSNSNPLRRGDKIISLVRAGEKGLFPEPPPKTVLKVLRGEATDQTAFRQGELVILDHGQDEGLLVGHQFRAYRDEDPTTKSPDDVIPGQKGAVQLVWVGKKYSVGYVLESMEPIFKGDTLVSLQTLPEKPRSKRSLRAPILIE